MQEFIPFGFDPPPIAPLAAATTNAARRGSYGAWGAWCAVFFASRCCVRGCLTSAAITRYTYYHHNTMLTIFGYRYSWRTMPTRLCPLSMYLLLLISRNSRVHFPFFFLLLLFYLPGIHRVLQNMAAFIICNMLSGVLYLDIGLLSRYTVQMLE